VSRFKELRIAGTLGHADKLLTDPPASLHFPSQHREPEEPPAGSKQPRGAAQLAAQFQGPEVNSLALNRALPVADRLLNEAGLGAMVGEQLGLDLGRCWRAGNDK